jgi:hypothetical protein
MKIFLNGIFVIVVLLLILALVITYKAPVKGGSHENNDSNNLLKVENQVLSVDDSRLLKADYSIKIQPENPNKQIKLTNNNQLKQNDSVKSIDDLCSEKEINRLIKELGGKNTQASKGILKALSGCSNKAVISNLLSSKLKQTCSGDEVLFSNDLRIFEEVINIQSRFRSESVVEDFVGCINHSSAVAGLSSSNYPAQVALIKYGDFALPVLRKNLLSGKQKVKCSIALILPEIGGKEALSILKEALQRETDKEVLSCIEKAIKSIDTNY